MSNSADIIIIGGGIAGMSLAARLAAPREQAVAVSAAVVRVARIRNRSAVERTHARLPRAGPSAAPRA